jgi:hypothetical protein
MEFITISCARTGCHAIFQLPDEMVSRLQETHENFVCPFGHHQNYPNKTETEKRYESKLRALENLNENQAQQISDLTKKLRTAKSSKAKK